MTFSYRFTDDDIQNLKQAKEALQQIKCEHVDCGRCPLYIGNGCMINHLGFIVHEAETGGTW